MLFESAFFFFISKYLKYHIIISQSLWQSHTPQLAAASPSSHCLKKGQGRAGKCYLE